MQGGRPPIALIGADARAKSGYSTWPELLQCLHSAASKRNKATPWKKNLDDINDAPDQTVGNELRLDGAFIGMLPARNPPYTLLFVKPM
jgi:hypothetical protein